MKPADLELASDTEIAWALLHWQDLTAQDAEREHNWPANYQYFQLPPQVNS